jgi:hypothetical protein
MGLAALRGGSVIGCGRADFTTEEKRKRKKERKDERKTYRRGAEDAEIR